MGRCLFGETQSKIIVSISPYDINQLTILANQNSVPIKTVGKVGGNSIVFSNLISITLEEVAKKWDTSLENLLN